MRAEPFVGLLAELTHRCPLSCGYCSNPLELERRHRELTTDVWRDVFVQAAEGGALHVHLSGGEPAARADLEDLVEHAARAGLYTNLVTSGLGLTRARVEECARRGLDHLQLSLQAASAALADEIAGRPGSFEHKREVARWTRELGLPLTLNVVLHRRNVDEVDALVALAEAWGARRLELAHVQLMGWAWHNRDALVASREDVARAAQAVDRARHRTRVMIDHVGSDVHAGRPKACMDGWGARFVVVDPAGRVLPCHGASALPLSFPNVRDATLAEAWRSEPFERFRCTDALAEPCASCPESIDDRGGCRCQAFLATGDVYAADPACDLAPSHGALVRLRRPKGRAVVTPRRFG